MAGSIPSDKDEIGHSSILSIFMALSFARIRVVHAEVRHWGDNADNIAAKGLLSRFLVGCG